MSWSLGRYSCVTMRNVENLHYITILLAQRMNSQLPIKSSMPTATCNEFQVVDEDWIEWVFIQIDCQFKVAAGKMSFLLSEVLFS